MVNKKTHKRRVHRKKKIMKGGAYNPEELETLRNNNFTDNQIETLENMDIPINEVMRKINDRMNQGENPDDITDIVMEEIMDENIFQNQNNNVMNMNIAPIQNNEEDIHYLYDDDLNSSRNSSIHLSDLNDSRMSGYTTNPDESFSSDESFMSDQSFGGKKRQKRLSKKIKKNKKGKKSRKNRKSKKQRGWTRYGSGVDANNYDPNFSIHNTRELELFPYKSREKQCVTEQQSAINLGYNYEIWIFDKKGNKLQENEEDIHYLDEKRDKEDFLKK